ncbi:unnamed protein product [Linum tenue]|uniref:Uncharacterized protein n=1 Tax=Linum tenue TaxID=586396 RepID=A0AAV0GSQ9_9ROSI|nr:unnamed protein product [Linum tenue]
MKPYLAVFGLPESKKRSWLCSVFIAASLICGIYFLGFASVGKEYKEQKFTRWPVIGSMSGVKAAKCKNQRMPIGSEPLPSGIVAEASDLEMRPLWSASTKKEKKQKRPMSLLAIAVGIQQKEVVNRIVGKFPSSDFIVMLFHYDGVVEKWGDLSWSDRAIHISAVNQTKWWFAKRFLHPDIVAEYDYVFIWDEDIGVENFNPSRYLSVVKEQGLEISQPALDRSKSEVHFPITARNRKSTVHRLVLKLKSFLSNCSLHYLGSWVEIMAPVFSKAAWRCVWYMIQNDLIHAWGLDTQLGYCAQVSNTISKLYPNRLHCLLLFSCCDITPVIQGDRAKNVGVVDSEYIVHLGLPTLGVFNKTEVSSSTT